MKDWNKTTANKTFQKSLIKLVCFLQKTITKNILTMNEVKQEKGVRVFNSVLEIALKVPGVKVNREAFLRNAFSDFCTEEQLSQIVKTNPRKVLDINLIDHVAQSVIKKARIEVTSVSAASGLPSNPFLASGLAVADVGQYMGFSMNISQKLAYIYGFPDLLKNGELTPNGVNILTALFGVMFGVSEAVKAVNYIAKALAVQMVKKLPAIAFGHAAWYVLIKKIARWIGIKMSKQLFAKTAAKIVPFVGAGVSGVLTYASFGPQAKKLATQLRYNSKYFVSEEKTAQETVNDAEFQEMDK